MEQLLAHLVGDYVIQNHWMANQKVKSHLPALIHAYAYGIPFLLLTQDPLKLLVITGTHFVIDRWRLAQFWMDFWGTGKPGWVGEKFKLGHDLPEAPLYATFWLRIIIDNTMHLTINFCALNFL